MAILSKKNEEALCLLFLRASGSVLAKSIIWILLAIVLFSAFCYLCNEGWLDNITREIASVFLGVLAATLCASVTLLVMDTLRNRLEDACKLTRNYESIISKYEYSKEDFFVYYNSRAFSHFCGNLSFYASNDGISVFPEEIMYLNRSIDDARCKARLVAKNVSIRIIDRPDVWYALPQYAHAHFDDLFHAHSTSFTINAPMLRIDSCLVGPNQIIFTSSRTTYFDSLVTNRALDVELSKGLTLRIKENHANRLTPLRESVLSNHLGLHCIILTSDGFYVFVLRGKDVTIGKSMLGISMMAAYKLRGFESERIGFEHVFDGLEKELEGELGIEADELIDCTYATSQNHMVAFYRDWVEGGKPQLLFSYSSVLTAKQISAKFDSLRRKSRNPLVCDGFSLRFLRQDETEPKDLALFPDGFFGRFRRADEIECGCVARKWFDAMPSTTASMALYLLSDVCGEMAHSRN
ncbi:hypothetical protein GS424_008290 [Eggerthella guodeyinii]|uniref:Nudix hydrolase domain-containing protein n=1 Tax=Eggerthella guodeyinii TaxID=2690837 RepID=A0A6L7IQT1_9ACTN|nr:hypothetical protein [Eggerthella guodeyinii]QOS69821.1 hypothetical protein GS424_008290 [Eggerthella guodeyinii]